MIAITPGETWEWIHESDLEREPDDQTVFVCRVLTSRQNAWVENHYAGSMAKKKKGYRQYKNDDRPDVEFRAGDYRRAAIIAGLVDVKRLKDSKGEPIEYVTRRATIGGDHLDVPVDSFLDRIHAEVLVDLATAITDGPSLTEPEKKS